MYSTGLGHKKGANFPHKLSKMTQNGIYLGLREPHSIWLNTVSLVVTNMEATAWLKCFLQMFVNKVPFEAKGAAKYHFNVSNKSYDCNLVVLAKVSS